MAKSSSRNTKGIIPKINPSGGSAKVALPQKSLGAKPAPAPLATSPASSFRKEGLPAGKPAPALDKKIDPGSY